MAPRNVRWHNVAGRGSGAARVLAGAFVILAIVLVAAAGCGTSDRPSAFGTVVYTMPGSGDSGPPSIQLAPQRAPTCNLGPEGGVCECVDQPLLVDVPNLYFVLDRSGSMAEANKWSTVQSVLAQLFISLGPRARVGAAVFPNPAYDQCSAGVEVFSTRSGDAPAGTLGPIEQSLFTALRRIPAAGGTPTASTLASLLPRVAALAGRTYVILATDGGPNCNAGARCSIDQCTDNIEDAGGCPVAGPVNCCDAQGFGGPAACLDAQPALDAVGAFAAAGIPVYVVGVPGSAPYASLLDRMAIAGGTARDGEPQYYAVAAADQASLQTALTGIAAKITGTCTLDLGPSPADPERVNVFFDEKAVPQAGPDGWSLDGGVVTLLGASCQKVLQGAVIDVRVVAGCPTVAY
jgi:von Willebrand factor type A domain